MSKPAQKLVNAVNCVFLSSITENAGGRKLKFGEFCWHNMASFSYVVTFIVLKAIIDPQEVENFLKYFKGRTLHVVKQSYNYFASQTCKGKCNCMPIL